MDSGRFVEIHDKRSILLLGPVGAGKATIIHRLTGTTRFEIKEGIDGLSRAPTVRNCEGTVGHILYNFVLVDSSSAYNRGSSTLNENFKKAARIAMGGFNLILVVLRKGSCTAENLSIIIDLLQSNFDPSFRDICAIVHTGCENLNDSKRHKFLTEFQSGDIAYNLSSLANKNSYCIGFPDITKEEEFIQIYTERSEKDKKMLENMIGKSDQRLTVLNKRTLERNAQTASNPSNRFSNCQLL